jgi:hypothetical protein
VHFKGRCFGFRDRLRTLKTVLDAHFELWQAAEEAAEVAWQEQGTWQEQGRNKVEVVEVGIRNEQTATQPKRYSATKVSAWCCSVLV